MFRRKLLIYTKKLIESWCLQKSILNNKKYSILKFEIKIT